MKKYTFIIFGAASLLMLACNSRKSASDALKRDIEGITIMDSVPPDTLHHPMQDELKDGHMSPPPPDGKHFDGPPPPPPRGKGHPRHQPDNMRGFDPASEDDMDDNGMSRYMENYDDEGWD